MRRATLIGCLFLAACAEGPPTPGAPVTFEGVCGKANEGKRVMLEGYMEFPDTFGASEPTIMMRVRPSLESWQNVVGAGTRLGNGANSVELPPKTFKRSDMKLHLADGQVVGYGNKVKVSGTMYYPSAIAHVEFKCGISNTMFERGEQ
jgi:hypothetical protein